MTLKKKKKLIFIEKKLMFNLVSDHD